MLQRFFILLAVVILFSGVAISDGNQSPEKADAEAYLIDDPHFGVNLGDGTADIEAKCKAKKIGLAKNNYSYVDKDYPAEIWSFDGALNRNESIEETKLHVFQGYVFEVEFIFKDTTHNNYTVLKEALEKKYSPTKKSLFNSLSANKYFTYIIDGKRVVVVLSHDSSMTRGGTLLLRYTHDALKDQVEEKLKEIKAKKVADEL